MAGMGYNCDIVERKLLISEKGDTVGKLEAYIQVGQERLRCGYTTGTCAAAAAAGAAELLLTGEVPVSVLVDTPAGITVEAELESPSWDGKTASAAVRKDGGDDPDVTDGVLICASVTKLTEPEIVIEGGVGVGRVTRPGLDQPVGSAAINSTPRRMIHQQLEAISEKYGYPGGFLVIISIPEGEKLADKTFNPRLGIVGGISVLGTSGIVRPMSEAALVASIRTEMDVRFAEGVRDLLVSPGNYGVDFCRTYLGLELNHAVQCSNYIGEMLDYAAVKGFRSLLLVGHMGKLVKCAAGVMNTHSRVADCRMEVLASYAALKGGNQALIGKIMNAVTTDEAAAFLEEEKLLYPVMAEIASAAGRHLQRRAGSEVQVEAVLFSNRFGVMGMTEGAKQLLEVHKRSED